MGEAKQKGNRARDIAYAKSKFCIYCGGGTVADTVDHCPPRSLFVGRQWPEGFVFPACQACNSLASDSERVAGFLTRIYSDGPLSDHEADLTRYLADFRKRFPKEMDEFVNVPSARKRKFVKDLNYKLSPGELYRDIPIVLIPQTWIGLLKVFGVKLTKGIHFHETGRIAPSTASVYCAVVPNAMEMKTPFSPEIFSRMGRSYEIVRANKDLSKQFGYLSERTVDGKVAIYVYQFGYSFKLICLYGEDESLVKNTGEALQALATSGVTPSPAQSRDGVSDIGPKPL